MSPETESVIHQIRNISLELISVQLYMAAN